MKKTLLLIALMLCCAMTIFAQNNRISYQAVVRDTENKLVANKDVTVTVKIFDGDVQQPAYTQTYENVHTNLNGLISLLIGPAQPNEAWNSIQWNQARIETTVTLDNTSLGTLKMPLTAVPYALYAKEISPDGTVITNIYNKMQQDSAVLAEKMRADSLLLHDALNDSTANVRGALKDSVTNVNTRMQTMADNLHNEISTLDNKVTTRMNTISDSVKTTLDSVTTVSTNLHNEITTLDNKVTTRMNTISDSVKTTLDSVTTVSTNLHNEITAVSTDMQTNYAKLAGANTFTGNNTFSGNNTFTGPVTASSVTVTCGNSNLDICTMYNELTQLIAGMQNTIDSLKDVITELLPSLSLKGTKDTVFTNGNTVNVTYTANFSNANSSDYTFQWKVDGTSVNYASNPYTHTYTTIGTHKVVCTATRTGYATLTDSITTTISKGTPVMTAPTAANNLTYNTNAQTLVNAGTTTGGTLYYNVTTTNSKPAADASGWSTDLPTGTNAGTYYVWYKVVGGDNYNNVDVSNTSVAVTIAKAALSSLSVSMNNWTYDQTAQNPSVSGNAGNGTVTYSYKVKTEGDNTYTQTKPSNAGNYTVKASVAETGNYQAGTATKDFTINQAAGSISYTTTSLTKNVGAANFTNTLTNPGDGTVTYSISNNGSSCSIDPSTGEVTVGNSVGTATITATVTDGTNYSYATNTATYTLTVQAASLTCLTVSQGDAPDGWGNQCFYYIPGETYEQALNHVENKNEQIPGWGHWAGNSNSHATLFYKKGTGQNDVWDVTIGQSTDFTDIWTTVVDPSKTHYFSHRQ